MADFVDRYTYRVIWWEEDQEYVGLCAEFPLLSHLDETPEKAFAGIRDLIAFCVEDLQEEGEPVPEPFVYQALQRHHHSAGAAGHPSSPGDGRSRGGRQHEPVGKRTAGDQAKIVNNIHLPKR